MLSKNNARVSQVVGQLNYFRHYRPAQTRTFHFQLAVNPLYSILYNKSTTDATDWSMCLNVHDDKSKVRLYYSAL